MARKRKLPRLPKLYKVLEDGKSCNNGVFDWNTTGGLNVLPAKHNGQRLKHCSVGFHLTTDWLAWYKLGRDVYTATVAGGEILVRLDSERICEDKVVADRVRLSQKNEEPLAKLLKQFYNSALEVAKGFQVARAKKAHRIPNHCVAKHSTNYWDCYPTGALFDRNVPMPGLSTDQLGHFQGALAFIAGILVKSETETATDEQRQQVHDVWNLWKKGWIVHGISGTGKYIVS